MHKITVLQKAVYGNSYGKIDTAGKSMKNKRTLNKLIVQGTITIFFFHKKYTQLSLTLADN